MRGNDYDGQLIALESLDGGGKTSTIEAIDAWSDSRDTVEVVLSKEPTDMWTGERVYDALQKDTDAATDFLLFCADRREHIEKRVKPALERGAIVVTDRYADSTRAYQTHRVAESLNISYDEARRYIDDIMDPWTIEPDLTFYIDISVDTALERCGNEDKFEKRENLEQVKDAYTEMYSHCDPHCRIVNGEMSLAYVRHQAVNAVKSVVGDDQRDPDGDSGRTYADAVEEDRD